MFSTSLSGWSPLTFLMISFTTVAWLMVFGGIAPYVIQMITSYFVGGHKEFHKTSCVFFSGLGLTILLTNSVKLYVGYLRPIFYDICEPDEAYEECTSGEDREARLSFPSGHASFSFCGLVLLSLYLERSFGITKVRVWKHDESTGQIVLSHTSHPGLRRIISIVCYAPVLLAGFIAASRVADNKHFPADVVGGSILGSSVAMLVHGIWCVNNTPPPPLEAIRLVLKSG
jgi:diacylglycerol diphosphate phosphatase/phosphatidate phosphatase